jgi:hypothetical protein
MVTRVDSALRNQFFLPHVTTKTSVSECIPRDSLAQDAWQHFNARYWKPFGRKLIQGPLATDVSWQERCQLSQSILQRLVNFFNKIEKLRTNENVLISYLCTDSYSLLRPSHYSEAFKN